MNGDVAGWYEAWSIVRNMVSDYGLPQPDPLLNGFHLHGQGLIVRQEIHLPRNEFEVGCLRYTIYIYQSHGLRVPTEEAYVDLR